MIRRPLARLRNLLAVFLACTALAHADSPPINPTGLRGDLSGTWYNPAQPGHGLTVEVIDRGRATVAWFTFDTTGKPMWLFGLATIEQHSLRAQVSTSSGARFGPDFDPEAVVTAPWGELVLDFIGCESGVLRWTPTAAGFTAGSMPLSRLTAVQGTRCNAEEEFSETRAFSLEHGNLDFEAVFADRPPNEDQFYELDYVYEPLPEPITGRMGVRLSGNNHSDDLAMLVKRELKGLKPDAIYRVEVEAEIASNVPSGCAGIGGSPGESVYLKLGASTQEPLATTAADGWLRMNIDYGQQSQSGANALVVGTLGNSYSCDAGTQAPWELRTISTKGQMLRMRTDASGSMWLVVGSDSAFEGRTDFYITAVRARLQIVTEALTR
jgi:hypothetical protein